MKYNVLAMEEKRIHCMGCKNFDKKAHAELYLLCPVVLNFAQSSSSPPSCITV